MSSTSNPEPESETIVMVGTHKEVADAFGIEKVIPLRTVGAWSVAVVKLDDEMYYLEALVSDAVEGDNPSQLFSFPLLIPAPLAEALGLRPTVQVDTPEDEDESSGPDIGEQLALDIDNDNDDEVTS